MMRCALNIAAGAALLGCAILLAAAATLTGCALGWRAVG